MYQSPTSHKVYGFSITIQGILTQYEILDSDDDGLLGDQRRTLLRRRVRGRGLCRR